MCAPVDADIRSAVFDKQSGQLSLVEGFREDFVAWANFTDDIKTSGWVDCRVHFFSLEVNILFFCWNIYIYIFNLHARNLGFQLNIARSTGQSPAIDDLFLISF